MPVDLTHRVMSAGLCRCASRKSTYAVTVLLIPSLASSRDSLLSAASKRSSNLCAMASRCSLVPPGSLLLLLVCSPAAAAAAGDAQSLIGKEERGVQVVIVKRCLLLLSLLLVYSPGVAALADVEGPEREAEALKCVHLGQLLLSKLSWL